MPAWNRSTLPPVAPPPGAPPPPGPSPEAAGGHGQVVIPRNPEQSVPVAWTSVQVVVVCRQTTVGVRCSRRWCSMPAIRRNPFTSKRASSRCRHDARFTFEALSAAIAALNVGPSLRRTHWSFSGNCSCRRPSSDHRCCAACRDCLHPSQTSARATDCRVLLRPSCRGRGTRSLLPRLR